MRIGITYDLKDATSELSRAGRDGPAYWAEPPDDLQEEFDSPVTIEAIAEVLHGLGHEVERLGDGRELLERLLARPPDLVFNFAEGQGVGRAREARVPALLEMLGIPYTGSDPLTLAVTLDKDCAKRLVASAGVVVPFGVVIEPGMELKIENYQLKIANCDSAIFNSPFSIVNFQFPVFVKPAWEGSSKGIRGTCLVERPDQLAEVVDSLRRDYRQPILVEEFISGEEITVGVIGNAPPQVLGSMRVVPNQPTSHFVYSLEVKRDFRRQVRYEVPPALPSATLDRIQEAAVRTYRVLGCRDVSRIDFRVRDGVPYFLEVNPLPGLNPESSDLVILAQLAGWSYPRLIEAILQAALDRQNHLLPRVMI